VGGGARLRIVHHPAAHGHDDDAVVTDQRYRSRKTFAVKQSAPEHPGRVDRTARSQSHYFDAGRSAGVEIEAAEVGITREWLVKERDVPRRTQCVWRCLGKPAFLGISSRHAEAQLCGDDDAIDADAGKYQPRHAAYYFNARPTKKAKNQPSKHQNREDDRQAERQQASGDDLLANHHAAENPTRYMMPYQ